MKSSRHQAWTEQLGKESGGADTGESGLFVSGKSFEDGGKTISRERKFGTDGRRCTPRKLLGV